MLSIRIPPGRGFHVDLAIEKEPLSSNRTSAFPLGSIERTIELSAEDVCQEPVNAFSAPLSAPQTERIPIVNGTAANPAKTFRRVKFIGVEVNDSS